MVSHLLSFCWALKYTESFQVKERMSSYLELLCVEAAASMSCRSGRPCCAVVAAPMSCAR